MRRPQVTLKRMMMHVASAAVLLAAFRWNPGLSITTAVASLLPSAMWAGTGGKIWWSGGKTWWRGDTPRGTIGERLALFAWAWFLTTIGLLSVIYVMLQIQGVNLGMM